MYKRTRSILWRIEKFLCFSFLSFLWVFIFVVFMAYCVSHLIRLSVAVRVDGRLGCVAQSANDGRRGRQGGLGRRRAVGRTPAGCSTQASWDTREDDLAVNRLGRERRVRTNDGVADRRRHECTPLHKLPRPRGCRWSSSAGSSASSSSSSCDPTPCDRVLLELHLSIGDCLTLRQIPVPHRGMTARLAPRIADHDEVAVIVLLDARDRRSREVVVDVGEAEVALHDLIALFAVHSVGLKHHRVHRRVIREDAELRQVQICLPQDVQEVVSRLYEDDLDLATRRVEEVLNPEDVTLLVVHLIGGCAECTHCTQPSEFRDALVRRLPAVASRAEQKVVRGTDQIIVDPQSGHPLGHPDEDVHVLILVDDGRPAVHRKEPGQRRAATNEAIGVVQHLDELLGAVLKVEGLQEHVHAVGVGRRHLEKRRRRKGS